MLYSNGLPVNIPDINIIDLTDTNSYASIKNASIVLWMDSLSDNKMLEWYASIRTFHKHSNKIVLLMDKNSRSNIRKQITMLLASLGCYNIYEVNSENVDSKFIENVVNREASELEVEEYIGCDISAYDKASEIILRINDMTFDGNLDSLADYIEENKEVIRNIPVVVDFLKKSMESNMRGSDIRVEKMKRSLDEAVNTSKDAQNKYKEAMIKLKTTEEERDKLATKSSTLEKDVSALNSQKKTLEKRVEDLERDSMGDFEELNVTKYRAIDTVSLRNLKKYIIYFKEMSHVTYARTMTEFLAEYLRMCGKKVLYVIYDRKNDFIGTMKGCTIVNGEILSRNPSVIANAVPDAPILVTDTNMSVLNALLKSNVDVLIIFDRLRCKENLVVGSLVTKFNIVGSRQQLEGLTASTGEEFPHNKTILEKPFNDYLFIPTIERFGSNRNSDTSSYASIKVNGNETLFDSILDSCGIQLDI